MGNLKSGNRQWQSHRQSAMQMGNRVIGGDGESRNGQARRARVAEHRSPITRLPMSLPLPITRLSITYARITIALATWAAEAIEVSKRAKARKPRKKPARRKR